MRNTTILVGKNLLFESADKLYSSESMYSSKAYVTPEPTEVGTGKVYQILGNSCRMGAGHAFQKKG